MTFHMLPPDSVDTPPELAALYGLNPPQTMCGHDGLGRFRCLGGLGIPLLIPFAIAGAGAAGATISSWLGTNWDVGTYNSRKINDTIHQWDAQGWKPNNCWGKYPAKRRAFKAFWSRWSKHYGKYGTQSVYLSDAAEMPVRNVFLPELEAWGRWLNETCKIDTAGGIGPVVQPDDGGGPTTDIAQMVKWGALGIGAIVLLNVVQGVRGALPQGRSQM
jgi:hypothetical protein